MKIDQLRVMHLQGKVVGEVPVFALPGAPTRPVLAAEEFASNLTSLEDAIAAAQRYTAGRDKPGALIISGRGKFEAYALQVGATLGSPAGPFHFEGVTNAAAFPRHTRPEGVVFVDGATVIRR